MQYPPYIFEMVLNAPLRRVQGCRNKQVFVVINVTNWETNNYKGHIAERQSSNEIWSVNKI